MTGGGSQVISDDICSGYRINILGEIIMFKENNQEIKLHYKMYKDGKRWVFASLAAASLGFMLAGSPQTTQAAQADSTQTTTAAQTQTAKSTTPAGSSQDNSSVTPQADQSTTAPVDQQATAASSTPAPTEQATTTKVSEQNVKTQGAGQSSAQPVVTPASAGSKTVSKSADTEISPTARTVTPTSTSTAQVPAQTTAQTPSTSTSEGSAKVSSPQSAAQAEPVKNTDQSATTEATPTTKTSSNVDAKSTATVSTKQAAVSKTTTNKTTDPAADQPATKAANTDPQKTAENDYQTAKDKTDHANDLADKANQSAAALQDLLKDPKPGDNDWLTKVNTALNDLAKSSNDFTGTKITTDDVVAAYETALKNMPNQPQPGAVQSVKVGNKDEAATLANYNKLVDAYTDQVNTILAHIKNGQANYATAEALNAAQQQLKTAADQLNAAIKQAVDNANAGDTDAVQKAITGSDAAGHTLDNDKTAYDDALTAYNTNVTVYNATTTDPNQKITLLGTNSDTANPTDPTMNPSQKDFANFKNEIVKAAAQNNAYKQSEAANAAYNNIKAALSDLAAKVADWQAAADKYNQLVDSVNTGTAKTTAADLTNGQTAVITAQTALANQVKQFKTINDAYTTSLANYQTALNEIMPLKLVRLLKTRHPVTIPVILIVPGTNFKLVSLNYKMTLLQPERLARQHQLKTLRLCRRILISIRQFKRLALLPRIFKLKLRRSTS